nr:hypothetical protein CFP56_16211 [Quercus suber]
MTELYLSGEHRPVRYATPLRVVANRSHTILLEATNTFSSLCNANSTVAASLLRRNFLDSFATWSDLSFLPTTAKKIIVKLGNSAPWLLQLAGIDARGRAVDEARCSSSVGNAVNTILDVVQGQHRVMLSGRANDLCCG